MKNLNELVKQEAYNIKLHATESEKDRLHFSSLDPTLRKACVYGLMTGDCFSEMAANLLNLCALECVNEIDREEPFQIVRKEVFTDSRQFFSPLEYYINQEDADNEQLIKYIKGQTDTLTL